MGQAVKYALLGAVLVAVIASIVVFINVVYPSTIFATISSAVSSFISVASPYIQNARGAMNYFFGAGSPTAIRVILYCSIILPFLLFPVRVIIAVAKWINQ